MTRSADIPGPTRLVVSAAVAIALGLGTVRLVWEAAHALALVVLAITLAAALAPLAGRLDQRMPRTLAVIVVYGAVAVILALLAWYVVPRLGRELQELARRAPSIGSSLEQQLRQILPGNVQLPEMLWSATQQLSGTLQRIPGQVASFLFDVLVVVFLSIYFLIASAGIHRFIVSLFSPHRRRRASLVLCRMAHAMGGYFRGVAIDAAIIGALTWGMLSVIGIEFAAPLAALSALGEFVPYIGPLLAALPAIALGTLQSVQQGVMVAAGYFILQQIESHIVTPNVMHSQTAIQPATVIVALTVGFSVGGLLGAITAIPIFAAGRVVILHEIAPMVRRAARRSREPIDASEE